MNVKIHAAAITVSDRGARGEIEDVSGAVLIGCLGELSAEIVEQIVVSDDFEPLVQTLIRCADDANINLIVTTGGTGFAPRDTTPEATRQVIEREAPGLAEAMRLNTSAKTPTAVLSRAVCGIRGTTLIVNLPGSPAAVRECFDQIKAVLPHAINLINGKTEHRDS